jgi:hypothetical protein
MPGLFTRIPAATLWVEPDWTSLGLVSAIVGCFLSANAILFEHPMRLVERHFSPHDSRRLRSIREYIYNRVQTTLGFSFLMGGFGLMLVGRYRPIPLDGRPAFSLAWVGVFVVVTIALLLTGWWWSLQAFRRYVRQYFSERSLDLEGEPITARELGQLFGIEPRAEDTVESYVARLRQKAGLPPPGRRGATTGTTTGTERDLEEELAPSGFRARNLRR